MLPGPSPLVSSIETSRDTTLFRGAEHQRQAALPQGTSQAPRDSNEVNALTENCEDRGVPTTSSSPKHRSSSSDRTLQLQHLRGVLVESNRGLMTPTGLVSMSAPPLPSNWYELAIKARAAALREAQRKVSTTTSLSPETLAEGQSATSLKSEDAVAPQAVALEAAAEPISASDPSPESEVGSVAESSSRPHTEPDVRTAAPLEDQLLVRGLVGTSTTNARQVTTPEATATTSSTARQPIIAALSSAAASESTLAQGSDLLRTEIMGPPPSLPTDTSYPPLNPVTSDAPAPAPTNHKRRGAAASGLNGTHRKSSAIQTPADYAPPTNMNGKMPYALFQIINKTPSMPPKPSHEVFVAAERSQSVASSDAAIASQGSVAVDVPIPAEKNVVDPLIADVLTDTDSVATATATRETSPDVAIVQDGVNQVDVQSARSEQSPVTTDEAARASTPGANEISDSLPAAALVSAAEKEDVSSPVAALRRNPSNRGASLLASQSITSNYVDPMGLKRHRESQLQQEARARRSPSATPTQSGSTAAAGGKKSNAARTLVPPPLIEPPSGMLYTPEGRLRTIPGIAGALVPPEPSSTSTDTKLNPRLEDKGSVNNDVCETCGGHGRFVCCDGCPRSFHFFCMSPPLDIDEMPASNAAEVLGPIKANTFQQSKAKAGTSGPSNEINMDEMWFCNVCVAERKPKAVQKPKGLGPFGQLLPLLSLQNPKSFQLPGDIRTYFKDVAIANDGDYVNGGMLRQIKPTKHGLIEARDPYRLKDKNGDVVLCYRCGGIPLPAEHSNDAQDAAAPADPTNREGTGWRKIVSCDFCPLHWHIDCVDPPMLGMPSNLRKWMCPAHSDHVNDRRRIARVGAAVPKTVDLPIPSARTIGPGKHFRTRVLNNGDIDIIPDPMELLMGGNGITGSLQSGVKGVTVVPGVVDAPAVTVGGSKLASKIRFRFPEKVIRTDFWGKVRADQTSKIGDVFYIAAEDIARRAPKRLMALENGVAPGDSSRYRPFGTRENAFSGLDALADIASARLKSEELTDDTAFIEPSRTRQLVHTALGIDLCSDYMPESNMRVSLSETEDRLSSSDSSLSSLSSSESEMAPSAAPPALAPVVSPAPLAPASALSEEELIKRIALEAASGVSSGSPMRLSKRKAAVAAESAIAGSPSTPAKKLRSTSPPAITTVSRPSTPLVTVPVEVRPATTTKKITLKTGPSKTLSESQMALRTAYHLTDQHADQRKEMEQLRAVRELMRLKGPGRLLEFLLSPNASADDVNE